MFLDDIFDKIMPYIITIVIIMLVVLYVLSDLPEPKLPNEATYKILRNL